MLAATSMAMFMVQLDFFALNLALPQMSIDLRTSTADLQFVIGRPRRRAGARRRPLTPALGPPPLVGDQYPCPLWAGRLPGRPAERSRSSSIELWKSLTRASTSSRVWLILTSIRSTCTSSFAGGSP